MNDNIRPDVTSDSFDDGLRRLLDGRKASELLSVPGVYEIVSEHFNNDVLDAIERPTWNVTITGDEEDDGEAPYVFVASATDDADAAVQAVVAWREIQADSYDEDDTVPEPRKIEVHSGMPSFGAYNDLRPPLNGRG